MSTRGCQALDVQPCFEDNVLLLGASFASLPLYDPATTLSSPYLAGCVVKVDWTHMCARGLPDLCRSFLPRVH